MLLYSDLQDRNLAKALVAAAQRALPKAKASRIARTWKARAVSLTREGKKRATPVEDDASQPVRLPLEVLDHVLAQLHPVSLARAACVCREWREAASAGRLWQRFLGGGGASEAPEPLQATARELFAAAASGNGPSIHSEADVQLGGAASGGPAPPRALSRDDLAHLWEPPSAASPRVPGLPPSRLMLGLGLWILCLSRAAKSHILFPPCAAGEVCQRCLGLLPQPLPA